MNKIVIIAYLKFIIDHLNSHYWTDYWIYNLTVNMLEINLLLVVKCTHITLLLYSKLILRIVTKIKNYAD